MAIALMHRHCNIKKKHSVSLCQLSKMIACDHVLFCCSNYSVKLKKVGVNCTVVKRLLNSDGGKLLLKKKIFMKKCLVVGWQSDPSGWVNNFLVLLQKIKKF